MSEPALAVKCPSCRSPKGATCLKLAVVPGGRVMWVSTPPHPTRITRARD